LDNWQQGIPFGLKKLKWRQKSGADLQLASAIPRTDMVEDLSGSPFIDELTCRRMAS
jgi:hypothetical protein